MTTLRVSERTNIFLWTMIVCCLLLWTLNIRTAKASGYTTLMDPIEQQNSQPDPVFGTNTVELEYQAGSVTISACKDYACSYDYDDAMKLTVTRPDQSTVFIDLVSLTAPLDPTDISDLLQPGTNSIYVEMYDIQPPNRGLSRPLYLLFTSEQPPVPDLYVMESWGENESYLYANAQHSDDPVNTFTGDFSYVYTDIAIAGRGPTPVFVRSYNSARTRVGGLGPGWTHNYSIRLFKPNESTEDVVVWDGNGKADLYTHNSDSSYSIPQAVTNKLVKNANGTYTLTNKEQFRWEFSETGLLLRMIDKFGNQSTLEYNSSDQVTRVNDPAGRGALVFSYNENGLLISVTDWLNREISFAYDSQGRLHTVTDRMGAITSYGYENNSQRLTTITDVRGNGVVTNTYDNEGRVATQKDAKGLISGQIATFNYVTNSDGSRTTTITYPFTSYESTWNYTDVHTHDVAGNLIHQIQKPTSDPNEWVTLTKTYDANGNVTSSTDGLGRTTHFCYDVDYSGAGIAGSYSNLTRRIAPAPNTNGERPVTLYKYDVANNLIQEIPPKSISNTNAISCNTDLSNSINLVFATDYVYDSSLIHLESQSSRYTDPDTNTIIAATTSFEYTDVNNPGMVTKMIPPLGNSVQPPDESFATTYQYGQSGDQAGMLVQVVEPMSMITSYQYDSVGRTISRTAPRGNEAGATASDFTWEYIYDAEDRQTFLKAPPPQPGGTQLVTQIQYDAVGNQVVGIDANGQVTKYTYDSRDLLSEVYESADVWSDPLVTPANVAVTKYEYDHLGNLARLIRGAGNSNYERAIDYQYDGMGRVRVETQYPDWPNTDTLLVTKHTYDANGNVSTHRDPLGQLTSYAYDDLNRLVSINYSSATTSNVGYAYDLHNNRLSMTDGNGTTTYTYDELSRLLEVNDASSTSVFYRYDSNGNIVSLTYPDGSVVIYAYDPANRMTTVTDWNNRQTNYEYLVNGLVHNLYHSNGVVAAYNYDNLNRLTQVWNKDGSDTFTQHSYTLDEMGYILQADEVLTHGRNPAPIDPSRQGTIVYQYDGMYRLTSEYRDLPTPQREMLIEYVYDPIGNRVTQTTTNYPFNSDITTFSYDKADRILSASGDLSENYTVDANGNMTARGHWGNEVQVFDQANRLIQGSAGAFTYNYTYDGDSRRTKIARGSTVINTFTYDINRALPVIIEDSEHKYIWGLDLLYVEDTTWFGEVGWYLKDALGSIRVIVDDEPEVELYEEYDAFGNEGYSNRLYNQPFKFTGEPDDEEYTGTNYVYLRARYYDPVIGRFISRDPFPGDTKAPLTLNRYSYVENNPVNKVDPSGLASSKKLQCAQGLIESELERQKRIFDALESSGSFIPSQVVGLISTGWQSLPGGIGESQQIKRILEESGISCIEYKDYQWDTSSYGNVIYGYQLKRLGYSLETALDIGEYDQWLVHGKPDPQDDKEQIKAGYRFGY